MLTLRALSLGVVKGSNALLEAQETLIDLSSFDLSLLVVGLAVLSSLRTSEIDQKEFTTGVDTLLLDLDLSDSMGPRGSIIGLSGMSCPHLVTLLDELQNLIIVVHELLLEARNLNGAPLIFSLFKLLMIVE